MWAPRSEGLLLIRLQNDSVNYRGLLLQREAVQVDLPSMQERAKVRVPATKAADFWHRKLPGIQNTDAPLIHSVDYEIVLGSDSLIHSSRMLCVSLSGIKWVALDFQAAPGPHPWPGGDRAFCR